MTESNNEKDVLVVVSKLKNYIKDSAGLNTSGAVPEILSQTVRKLCDRAVESARKDGRKTVMERDFEQCQEAAGMN